MQKCIDDVSCGPHHDPGEQGAGMYLVKLTQLTREAINNTDNEEIYWLKQFVQLAVVMLLSLGVLIGCCLHKLWTAATTTMAKKDKSDTQTRKDNATEDIGKDEAGQCHRGHRRSLNHSQQPTTRAVLWPTKGTTALALEQGYLADELRGLCRANGVMVGGTKKDMADRLAARFAELKRNDADAGAVRVSE